MSRPGSFLALAVFVLQGFSAASAQTPSNLTTSNVPALPADIPKGAVMHSVLFSGKKAGDEAVWKTPDGRLHVFLQFNDRGRGPKTNSIYQFNKNSVPTSIEITGNGYMKNPVDERFSVSSGVAKWKNGAESGEQAAAEGRFFKPLEGPPEDGAILARALLANGGKLALLPAGEARIEKLRELKVAGAPQPTIAVLYAIAGLDFTPTYIWLDSDKEFFAAGDTWFMVVRAGFEAAAPELIRTQSEFSNQRTAALAKRIAGKPKGDLIVRNVNLFDSESGKVVKNQTVVVSGNRIKTVTNSSGLRKNASKDAWVIDGTGKMLLPGLWDMHSHVSETDPLLDIAAGVTTVRDLGNDIDFLMAKKKRIDGGEETGPRIIPAGLIDGPGPFQGPTTRLASNESEARELVAKYSALGYPQIKIYSSLKPELVPVIIDEAHKRGMRVSGHIPANMIAEDCIKLGLNEMQHINFVMLNFMPEVRDTNTRSRFVEPAKRSADIDPKSERVQAFIRLLKKKKVDIDPTMSIFEIGFTGRPGQTPVGFAAIAKQLPVQIQRSLADGALPVPDGMDERYRQSYAAMKKMLKELYDDGVPIVAGTDSLAGFALHRELEIYNEVGIPANEVLRIATLKAAQIMSKDKELGSIAPGKLADMILVDGDPTQRISDIRKVRTIIKDGTVYQSADIYKFLGVAVQ